jgi:predicted DNA binding CopG/RHH family protein
LKNQTSILILGIILGAIIVYLFMGNQKAKTITEIKYDTITMYLQVPPITIKGKTSYIKTVIPDTVSKLKSDSLLAELECLRLEMSKLNFKEIAVLDTIINQDSINATYEYFSKQWYINLRLKQQEIKTVQQTVYIKESDNSKYWYGGVGLVVGIITGVIIK